jgi:tetratricopeptide (TPR) repeat protein
MGEYQKASEDFLESVQLNDKNTPSYVISLYHLGLTMKELGNCGNAYTYIEKAIKLNQTQGGLSKNEVLEAQNILSFLPVRQ